MAMSEQKDHARARSWVWRFCGFFDHRAELSVRAAIDDAVRALWQGRSCRPDDPVDFEQILDHRRIMAAAPPRSDWLDEFPVIIPLHPTWLEG
jgi:hypothetical protein